MSENDKEVSDKAPIPKKPFFDKSDRRAFEREVSERIREMFPNGLPRMNKKYPWQP